MLVVRPRTVGTACSVCPWESGVDSGPSGCVWWEVKAHVRGGDSVQRNFLAIRFQSNCPHPHLSRATSRVSMGYRRPFSLLENGPSPCASRYLAPNPRADPPPPRHSWSLTKPGRSGLAQLLGVSQDAEGDLAQKAAPPERSTEWTVVGNCFPSPPFFW